MNVSVRVPSIMRRGMEDGAAMTVNSGTCFFSASGFADLQEHGAREQAVPGLLRDDADGQAVVGVGAGVAILDENVAALQIALQAGQQRVEVLAA